MSIGNRLKIARKHAGLSQIDLVAKLNGLMSQQNISQLESGTNKGTEYVVQLAMACNVSPEWLAMGTGEMIKTTAYDLPPELLAHLKVLQELPDYARTEVIRAGIKTAELIATSAAGATKGTGTADK
jgi:transcriptional regulator with XRE-family HTH domain